MVIRIGSMCSGYGGLELAVAAALSPLGTETAWHCEIDPAAEETLGKRFPGTPNHGDLTEVDWSAVEPVDVLAMGIPCEPVSENGKRLVEVDPRWLWPAAYAGLIALRPQTVVFENVRNLPRIRKGEVWASILNDMRSAGYAVRWCVTGACTVGAPHCRHRVFALATFVGHARRAPVRVDTPECGKPGPLLPTPTARDGMGGPGHSSTGGLNLRTAVVRRWPFYAAPVARWEGITGVPAPAPTETGPRGGERLTAALPEWMMGLPAGWLTDHLGRDDAVRLAGKGVCPAQGAAALDILLTP